MTKLVSPRPKYRYIVLLILVVVLFAFALYYWLVGSSAAAVSQLSLADGSSVLLAQPQGTIEKYGIVIATDEAQLTDEQLLTLAKQNSAKLIQFTLLGNRDCDSEWGRFKQAQTLLGTTPDFVAGLKQGGNFAYRWLAQQGRDGAKALSIELDIDKQDCSSALPSEAEHGQWKIIWNDYPEDSTKAFIDDRQKTQVTTLIGDYDKDATEQLSEQLYTFIYGQTESAPVIEIPAGEHGPFADTVTFYYSGDGGWRDLDKVSGEYMAAQGYPVVGIDSLKLFWQYKSPERSAKDLTKLMEIYRQKWGTQRFILAGYSFGADVLPAIYNRLPANDKGRVGAIILIAFAQNANFEIAVTGWLGAEAKESQTAPEIEKIPAEKLFCIYGKEELAETGCLHPQPRGEVHELPGGHHFDENYQHLAEIMLQAIDKRMMVVAQSD